MHCELSLASFVQGPLNYASSCKHKCQACLTLLKTVIDSPSKGAKCTEAMLNQHKCALNNARTQPLAPKTWSTSHMGTLSKLLSQKPVQGEGCAWFAHNVQT